MSEKFNLIQPAENQGEGSNFTIAQLRAAKKKLESDIIHLVSEFERTTNVNISSVEVSNNRGNVGMGVNVLLSRNVNIKTDL